MTVWVVSTRMVMVPPTQLAYIKYNQSELGCIHPYGYGATHTARLYKVLYNQSVRVGILRPTTYVVIFGRPRVRAIAFAPSIRQRPSGFKLMQNENNYLAFSMTTGHCNCVMDILLPLLPILGKGEL